MRRLRDFERECVWRPLNHCRCGRKFFKTIRGKAFKTSNFPLIVYV